MEKKRPVMTLNVLGTEYTISKRKFDEDPDFHKYSFSGYCDSITKEIVYCDMSTAPDWKDEPKKRIALEEKTILRHEIVHAFLNESGLESNSVDFGGPWAKNEEMVDWIALQGRKIYAAWRQAKAI